MSLCTQRCSGRHNVLGKICKSLVVYRFYSMALFHTQAQRHMIKGYLRLCMTKPLKRTVPISSLSEHTVLYPLLHTVNEDLT